MKTTKKYIYAFAEGRAEMKDLLGGKGANLAEMTRIGLPVPPGFTITTGACRAFYEVGESFLDELEAELQAALRQLENRLGKKFGDPANPLLVSVRSGAAFSMPGMMDTILNLGLNDETVQGLARASADLRFACDCYRRFIQMFSDVVLGVEPYKFENILEQAKEKLQVDHDYQLDAASLLEIVEQFKRIVKNSCGQEFPQDPLQQLRLAIKAVFASWNNQRAIVYRRLHKIPDHLGTAVNIQAMVFGNLGNDCGTGVAFTRNPSTGERELYGEFLLNAQGEDVVAGIRTPLPLAKLQEVMPEIYQQLLEVSQLLEKHYRDLQDIEFTVEKNKLYLLQTRNGKRTAEAAIKIAVDLVEEGLITREEALLRIEPQQIDQLLHRRLDPQARLEVIARGLPASPGAASGQIVFTADEAERLAKTGERVILVRMETTPDDIHGIVAAQGILTSRGGMTSHAAVVTRGMGKPCVCGCENIRIDYTRGCFTVNGQAYHAGDIITIDGSTGNVIAGEVQLIDPELNQDFLKFLSWADEIRQLGVYANADTPEDARKAREFGAEGIGLVRTEHMFMGQERLPIVQKMILATSPQKRQAALERLLDFQRQDFYNIFKAMSGLPVIIRLLDPPLHEFLPGAESLAIEVEKQKLLGSDPGQVARLENLLKQVRAMAEFNPMLGHRGCRLGITFPEIYRMQIRAIFEAAVQIKLEGENIYPEIMIPLVIDHSEMAFFRQMVDEVAAEVRQEYGVGLAYTVGACIELPRPCLLAGQIARAAEFFSFGTNDLTQTTLGFSRDDAERKFLPQYLEQKLLPHNPFAVLDREGVGELMRLAVERGRATRPELKVGICGEQGGEPESIKFCQQIGLNYVSCSPYRVPVARLAAAQAALGK